ncbi:MAG: hypothetical protein ALAOOOJD_01152 [bacterium]|nr:hypothetical protein [bacterium]
MIHHQERWLLLFTLSKALTLAGNTAPAVHESKCLLAIRAGDIAYANFDNHAAYGEYSHAVALDSSNYEALWKLARAYIDVGMSLPRNEKPQRYFWAEKTARRCVFLYPDSAEGHFFLAVALGRYALFVGGKRKVQIAREVRIEAERTLHLNPKHYGAMHVLGRWHYELANLNFLERTVAKLIFGGLPPGASYEKAAAYFEHAIALNPGAPVHRLDYGRTLIKLGRFTAARQQLEKCTALPQVFWDDDQHQREARQLLDKLPKS